MRRYEGLAEGDEEAAALLAAAFVLGLLILDARLCTSTVAAGRGGQMCHGAAGWCLVWV